MQLRPWLAIFTLTATACSVLTALDSLHGTDSGGSDAGDGGPSDAAGEADAAPASFNPVAVAVGQKHACAMASDGRVACWGVNGNGQLGRDPNTIPYATTPLLVAGINDAKAISAGDAHTCVIRASDAVSCWGDNTFGQLGVPTLKTGPSGFTPVDVEGLGGGALSVSGGFGFTCVVRKDLKPFCFGVPTIKCATGLDADSSVSDNSLPREIDAGLQVLSVSAGYEHTCFVTSPFKGAACMGVSSFGQVGQTASNTTCYPLMTVGGTSAQSIVTGRVHTCDVRSSTFVDCWGGNTNGQIADVTGLSTTVPKAIGTWKSPPMKAVSTKWLTTCAIASDGTVECVGANSSQLLGRPGDGGDSVDPDKVQGLKGVIQLSVGVASACAVVSGALPTDRNQVLCWGAAIKGLLGNGADDAGTSAVPVVVLLP